MVGIGVTAEYFGNCVYYKSADVIRKMFKDNIVSIIADYTVLQQCLDFMYPTDKLIGLQFQRLHLRRGMNPRLLRRE